jgi:hypothetical protein
MSCARCDGPLVVIEMALAGSDARMSSCSRCDHRAWLVDGAPAGLADVLAAVPSRRKAA